MIGQQKQTLSPEQQRALTVFEVGQRLAQIVNTPGWQDVLDILEDKVIKSEKQLISTPGVGDGSKDSIYWLHARARAVREVFDSFQQDIQQIIEDARQSITPPVSPSSTVPFHLTNF